MVKEVVVKVVVLTGGAECRQLTRSREGRHEITAMFNTQDDDNNDIIYEES